LSKVLPSVISAVSGSKNELGLPKAKAAVVVLIDGLGQMNLRERSAHARFMSGMPQIGKCYSTIPSTTASALTTLATGLQPVEHRVIGYSFLDSELQTEVNYLSGYPRVRDSSHLQKFPQLANSSPINFIGASSYENSGFTGLTFSQAKYVRADKLQDRFELALATKPGEISYVYVPELDQIGHRTGWKSNEWAASLELVDSLVKQLSQGLAAKGYGLLVTADHGMVDVDPKNHIELAEVFDTASAITSDPRARFIYLPKTVGFGPRIAQWQASLEPFGFLVGFEDLFDSKDERSPDFVLLAKGEFAFYDRRYSSEKSRRMIGQHGSCSDTELKLPLLAGGCF
jgi:predicted AlkP superfamily pyrophosphatase or phosphodiesterase